MKTKIVKIPKAEYDRLKAATEACVSNYSDAVKREERERQDKACIAVGYSIAQFIATKAEQHLNPKEQK